MFGVPLRGDPMIAIGGVIGAGLFVGSSTVILDTGPGAFLSYLVTGVLIILVMRMLGEMATANPSTGSFADYARRALGGWAGFSVAWLYWYFWVIVVGFEAVAGAEILTYWVDAPLWLLSLGLMVLMTATNLVSVSSYGEFEYWFAGIKVVAIIAFLVLGGAFVLGLARATQSVIVRVLTFYVGAVFLLVCIVPWDQNEDGGSPFVAAFGEMGIPYADHIMNAVVLTAVLSCLNSGLYTASRMIFVLAGRREAPMRLITTNSRGVPVLAILASTVVGFLSVVAAYVSPDTVFTFLLNSSGAVILFVYLLIAISQFVLRRRTRDEDLSVKMWLFPWLTIAAGLGIVAVLVQMFVGDDTRSQILLSLLSWGVVLGLFLLTRWRGGSVSADALDRLGQGDDQDDQADAKKQQPARRVLVLANRTLTGEELHRSLHDLPGSEEAAYHVVVPTNPVDTGQAEREGAAYVWEATATAASDRLEQTKRALREQGLTVDGELGDYRPLVALDAAVRSFGPDHIVISTQPEDVSTWLHHDVVSRARERYDVPVHHVVVSEPAPA